MENIIIRAAFGHEIMALNFAQSLNRNVVILPKKETKNEWEAESAKIYANLSFMSNRLMIVPFEEREEVEARSWDLIQDLKDGKLPDELWDAFASSKLAPQEPTSELPEYAGLRGQEKNILVVPQKLISDGECGVTAAQQSLSPRVFNFLKGKANLVLGQHFHKENDLPVVEDLAREFNFYVPGMSEHPEVFGIRGVQHKAYYNMYRQLSQAMGIAGTHTWIMLTMFPELPQVILYNRNGVENWKAIGKAFRKAGYPIYTIGFDENTNMEQLSETLEALLW